MECDIIDRTGDIVAVAPTRVLTLLLDKTCGTIQMRWYNTDKIMTDYCSFYFTTAVTSEYYTVSCVSCGRKGGGVVDVSAMAWS